MCGKVCNEPFLQLYFEHRCLTVLLLKLEEYLCMCIFGYLLHQPPAQRDLDTLKVIFSP